ncbi:hypothetical protein DL93DRAFT_2078251 [Clavulina sp. PMI_390]|nr:hypothetical protein DL93DRAFT_2078251 [Clavulina sp. PMI_390]
MDLLLDSQNNASPAEHSSAPPPTSDAPPVDLPPLLSNETSVSLESTDEDAAVLFGTPSPAPDRASLHPLPLPVALPQVRVAYDAPFVRAWNDELAQNGLQQDEWLMFLDGLNIAMVRSSSNSCWCYHHG